MAAATDNRFVHLSKTKMCKFHSLGKCKKGTECPFAHYSKELRPLPDLRCTKLCKSFILTGICPEEDCVYAHSKDELRSTGALRKTKLCRFEKTGHCALGSKCNFAHSVSELRDDGDVELNIPEEIPVQQPGEFILPPGLAWDTPPTYTTPPFAEYRQINAMAKDIADLNALAAKLDGMLSQLGQVAGGINEPACEAPGPRSKASNLAHDSPAYVHVTSTPDAWTLKTVSSQPIERKFDGLYGDGQSTSTRSTPSPQTPPSPTGSGRSSGMTSSQAMAEMYNEGVYGTPCSLGSMAGFPHLPPELLADPRLANGPFGTIMGA
mmetsp:Transcript_129112/g.234575  ORF Transcript_129112/g.234575 Transcript_129112/m.234575 type:complete len:322 (-) Transcript_129112:35-1000(-)